MLVLFLISIVLGCIYSKTGLTAYSHITRGNACETLSLNKWKSATISKKYVLLSYFTAIFVLLLGINWIYYSSFYICLVSRGKLILKSLVKE